MDITSHVITDEENIKIVNLTSNILNPKYSLFSLKISNSELHLKFNTDISSLIVINGRLEILNDELKYVLNKLDGIHLLSKGKLINLKSEGETLLLVGSTPELIIDYDLTDSQDSEQAKKHDILEFSDYKVDKPWGSETWYTQNINNEPYALKNIFMKEGFQSSLQSHKFKSETNIVIDGKAHVLYGKEAPEDESEKIDINSLETKTYSSYDGWSNKVNELHRVIAKTTYNAIEISTPELDDVIRWEDDNNRESGKIESEHRK